MTMTIQRQGGILLRVSWLSNFQSYLIITIIRNIGNDPYLNISHFHTLKQFMETGFSIQNHTKNACNFIHCISAQGLLYSYTFPFPTELIPFWLLKDDIEGQLSCYRVPLFMLYFIHNRCSHVE